MEIPGQFHLTQARLAPFDLGERVELAIEEVYQCRPFWQAAERVAAVAELGKIEA